MSALDDVVVQATGARFYRADLHIHSYGASHDVNDTDMTPDGIVSTARDDGLSIIAITDHNEINNVPRAIQASKGTSVLVIPGVELSTRQGHLLCYLPNIEILRRFHAQLDIADGGKETSRCKHSLLDCLNLLQSLG